MAKGEVVHVDASLIRADVSWASLAEHHADEVIRENPVEDEGGKKGGEGRRSGGSGPVSATDPDARLARKSRRAGFEPSYKHHAVVDDERGVVLDVAVTEGTLNEREMMESHLEAVSELSGRAPGMVTADSGYAYSRVYGALERRGVAGVIPAKGEPSQSRVPMSRFRYDARNEVVKCPRGKTLRPRRSEERGRWYVSRTRDCAGCALRADCLPKSQTSKAVLIPNAYPALLRARRRHARWGAEERRLWRRHMGRSEGYHGEAKTWRGLARAVRRGLENVRVQSYLTATAGTSSGWPPPLRRVYSPSGGPVPPGDAVCAHIASSRADWASSPPPRSRHTSRFRNGVFQQPLIRGVGGFTAKGMGSSEGIMLYSPRSPSLGLKTNPPVPPCQGGKNDAPPDEGFFNNPLKGGVRKTQAGGGWFWRGNYECNW